MEKYLIDTNVFFEMIQHLEGVKKQENEFDIEKLLRADCYISEITKIEIYSVIGKYARGEQEQWQACSRQVEKSGIKCKNKFYNPGRKRWSRKRVQTMKILVKDILEGNSKLVKLQVLPVKEEILKEAERFIQYAFIYKFASLDATIAGTANYYTDKNLTVVTHDKSFRKALAADGIHILEGVT